MVFWHSSSMWSIDMLAIFVNKNLWPSEKETFEDLILDLVREIWGKIEKMGEVIIFCCCLVGREKGRENWWGSSIFFAHQKYNLPKLGRNVKEKMKTQNWLGFWTKLSLCKQRSFFFFHHSSFFFFFFFLQTIF